MPEPIVGPRRSLSPRLVGALVAGVAGALVAVLLASASVAFPPPGGDDSLWLVAALNHRGGRGLVNEFNARPWGRNSVPGAIDYYPPLYALVLSGLMPSPSYPALLLAAALVKAATLALLAWALFRIARLGADPRVSTVACVVAALLGEFGLLYVSYRPEILVALVLAGLVALTSRDLAGPGVWGLALGLVAGANPMCGLLLTGTLVLYFARSREAAPASRAILLAAAVSVPVFLAVLAIGWGVGDTLHSTLAAARQQFYLQPRPLASLRLFFFQKHVLFAGLPVLAAAAALWGLAASGRARCRPLFWLGLAWLGAVAAEASILRPRQVYNVLAFTPLAAALLIARARGPRSWRIVAAFSLALPAAGALLPLAAYTAYTSCGVRFEQARRVWDRAGRRVDAGAVVASSTSLWGLADSLEDLQRFREVGGWRTWEPENLRRTPILVQQMYGSEIAPARLAPAVALVDERRGLDHVLAVDLFNRDIPTVLGVRLERPIPGWGFALYLPRDAVGPVPGAVSAEPGP